MPAVTAGGTAAFPAVASRGRLTPAWWHSRLTPAWWLSLAAATVLFGLDLVGELRGGGDKAAYASVVVGVMWLATGLTVWATRPQSNPLGPLWAWWQVTGVVETLPLVYPTNKAAFTVGVLLLSTASIMGAHWILMYPTGKL